MLPKHIASCKSCIKGSLDWGGDIDGCASSSNCGGARGVARKLIGSTGLAMMRGVGRTGFESRGSAGLGGGGWYGAPPGGCSWSEEAGRSGGASEVAPRVVEPVDGGLT